MPLLLSTPASSASGLALHSAPLFSPDSKLYSISKHISKEGTWAFLIIGSGFPFLDHEHDQTQRSLRTGDSIVTAVALAEGLKMLTHEKRPDSDEHDSFPSGHTTAAFALATARAALVPGQAVYWYAGATAIGISRLVLNRHHTLDVVAGAALGFLVARWEFSSAKGLLLNPVIINRPGDLGWKAEWAPAPTGWNVGLSGLTYGARF